MSVFSSLRDKGDNKQERKGHKKSQLYFIKKMAAIQKHSLQQCTIGGQPMIGMKMSLMAMI